MSQTNTGMSEGLLDAAACEAIGASTSEESAAYQQMLAAAGADVRRQDRGLRETVARMSAASPHMAPPPDLRGRILQATAPTTFKMEDYRKATKDNGWLFRWGFAAAMLFLSAGAYYNMTVKSELARSQQSAQALQHQVQERDVALSALVNPTAQQVTFTYDGKPFGKALVDMQNHTAIVILPREMVPAGKTVKLTLPQDGKDIVYTTVLITAPGDSLNAPKDLPLDRVMAMMSMKKELLQDAVSPPVRAEFNPH